MRVSPCRPSAAALERQLEAARQAPLRYPSVGGTATGALPPGFRADRASKALGNDPGAFERGKDALRRWMAHRGAGAEIHPPGAPLETGTTVLVLVRLVAVHVVAPCRIVYVTDEADRFGFAYGTLPGHPEEGEESFHVERAGPGGAVEFTVTAFSRPADPLVRLAAPVARVVQGLVVQRYLAGLASAAGGAPGSG